MALGNTNISINAVCGELGITQSVSRTWSYLMGYSGINKFARYAPGALSVDANKNTVLTPPTSNIKIGDFRSYNHASNTPSKSPPSTLNYTGSGSISFQMGVHPEAMNIWEYADAPDYFTFDLYDGTADRTSEVNKETISAGDNTKILSWSLTTPPTGHTRSNTQLVGSTQTTNIVTYNSLTNGWTTPNQTLYGDVYLSDNSNPPNRKINLGTVRSDGYFDFVAHQQQLPYITATGNIVPPPSTPGTWTAAWIAIHTNSTSCDETNNINQTWNSSTYSFYIKILGIYSTSTYRINATDCDVYLTHGGGKQLVHSGALSNTGTQVSGTLSNSNTWSYDEIGYVTIENVTFGTSAVACT